MMTKCPPVLALCGAGQAGLVTMFLIGSVTMLIP
jgi:hypothetical protein